MRIIDDAGNPYIKTSNFFSPLNNIHTPVFSKQEITYSGIGHVLDPENKFVFPILRNSSSAVSAESTGDLADTDNNKLSLVSGFQSLSNQRATISGSLEMCSDLFFAEHPNNQKFCNELIDWAMQESGVLRASNLLHNKVGQPKQSEGEPNPENYFIEDHVEYYITLEQKTKGKWHPLIASDVQMQFVMLEPYYRVSL